MLLAPAPSTFNNARRSYVAELLDWINRVASEEGPRFIQDSGKDGVAALSPTLNNLRVYARAALIKSIKGGMQDPEAVPGGYRTPRVQRAIRELADSLDDAYNLAIQIQGLQIPRIAWLSATEPASTERVPWRPNAITKACTTASPRCGRPSPAGCRPTSSRTRSSPTR